MHFTTNTIMAVVLILLGTPAFAQNEVGATLSTAATKSLVKKQALVESATSNQSAIGAPVYTQSPPVIPNSIVRIRAWGTNKCLSFDGSPQHNASFSDCNDSQNNYMKILLPNPFNSSLVEFQHAWSGLCLQSPSLGGQMGAASCSAQAARFTLQSQSNAPTEFYRHMFPVIPIRGACTRLQQVVPRIKVVALVPIARCIWNVRILFDSGMKPMEGASIQEEEAVNL